MTDEIKCPKYGSSQLTSQKRGFSGGKAIGAFIFTAILLGAGWAILIAAQNSENKINADVEKITHLHGLQETTLEITDYANNKALWVGTVFLLAVSLLYGTSESQKNNIVCLKCGNVQPLENKS